RGGFPFSPQLRLDQLRPAALRLSPGDEPLRDRDPFLDQPGRRDGVQTVDGRDGGSIWPQAQLHRGHGSSQRRIVVPGVRELTMAIARVPVRIWSVAVGA